MSYQPELGLDDPQHLSRHQALQFILFRIDAGGERLPQGSSTPDAAFLIGWRDDPGDPVFVSVGRHHLSPTEGVAVTRATNFLNQWLRITMPKPNFIIGPAAGSS